jgi:hypothetical protein
MSQYVMVCDDNGMRWEFIENMLPLTTKGNLVSKTADAMVGVGVGANGQVLTADSAQDSGLVWADVKLPLAAPTTPVAGSVYFDAVTSTLYVHNGTAWASTALTV